MPTSWRTNTAGTTFNRPRNGYRPSLVTSPANPNRQDLVAEGKAREGQVGEATAEKILSENSQRLWRRLA